MIKVSCCPRECSCRGQPHQPASTKGPYSGVRLESTQASLAGRSSLASRPAAFGGSTACGVGVMNSYFGTKFHLYILHSTLAGPGNNIGTAKKIELWKLKKNAMVLEDFKFPWQHIVKDLIASLHCDGRFVINRFAPSWFILANLRVQFTITSIDR